MLVWVCSGPLSRVFSEMGQAFDGSCRRAVSYLLGCWTLDSCSGTLINHDLPKPLHGGCASGKRSNPDPMLQHRHRNPANAALHMLPVQAQLTLQGPLPDIETLFLCTAGVLFLVCWWLLDPGTATQLLLSVTSLGKILESFCVVPGPPEPPGAKRLVPLTPGLLLSSTPLYPATVGTAALQA